MRNFVAVVFNSATMAYDGQHELWNLDREGVITVHGAVVVHRDDDGRLWVDTDQTDPPLATAVGASIGALLGALAGPAGAAVGAAGGAVIGATAGGVAGFIADVDRADVESQAGSETALALLPRQHAVIADVSEDWTKPIDEQMQRLDGTVYRRSRDSIRNDAWLGSHYPYYNYLYPYEYRPANYL